jgi:hypothetical protein
VSTWYGRGGGDLRLQPREVPRVLRDRARHSLGVRHQHLQRRAARAEAEPRKRRAAAAAAAATRREEQRRHAARAAAAPRPGKDHRARALLAHRLDLRPTGGEGGSCRVFSAPLRPHRFVRSSAQPGRGAAGAWP